VRASSAIPGEIIWQSHSDPADHLAVRLRPLHCLGGPRRLNNL